MDFVPKEIIDVVRYNFLQRIELTLTAVGSSRLARSAAMMDELMREQDPAVLRNNLYQVAFDLFRCLLLGQIQALRNALNVGIYDNSRRHAVAGAQDDVRRFARSPRNRQHFVHCSRDFSAEIRKYLVRRADNRFGLVIEKSSGANVGA